MGTGGHTMRKIVVLSFITLDGVMQAPGGPEEDPSENFAYGGWQAPYGDEAADKEMTKQLSVPFDLLLGRKTYDIFAGYWPKHPEIEFVAGPFNKCTKYVVSHANIDLPWENSKLITGEDVVDQLQQLKNGDGPMLQVHGSGNLVQTLLKHDMVDELWLKTYPLTLGTGKKLFAEGTMPAAFELTESLVTADGVIFANYKRGGEVKTGVVGA
jgi:dihydrofolate reductase